MHNYHIISAHSCSGVLNRANFSAHVTLDQLCKLLCIICMCRQHKYISKCISILWCRHLKSPRQFLVTEGWLTQWSMLSPVALTNCSNVNHFVGEWFSPFNSLPYSFDSALPSETGKPSGAIDTGKPQHNQCPKRKERVPNVHPKADEFKSM
jgi:hypothetical protein